MPTSGVHVEGLNELRSALRQVGPEWPKHLRAVHLKIAKRMAVIAAAFARAMGGVQAKAASAIKGRASQRDAKIGVRNSRGIPFAAVAFWGAKRHTGWYAKRQYASGPAQHDPWVGNSWEVAVAGQGPYAINDALASHSPQIVEWYGDMVDDLMREAFPE